MVQFLETIVNSVGLYTAPLYSSPFYWMCVTGGFSQIRSQYNDKHLYEHNVHNNNLLVNLCGPQKSNFPLFVTGLESVGRVLENITTYFTVII